MLFQQLNISGPTSVQLPWAPWPLLNQWLQFFAREHGMAVPTGPKIYQARIRFGRSSDGNPPMQGPFDWDGAANGDSYLINPEPVNDFAIRMEGAHCSVKFNAQNRLAYIELESVSATEIEQVLRFARKIANSLEFTMGMATNIPLFYDAIIARSVDRKESFVDTHPPVPTYSIGNGDSVWLRKPLRAVASLFLEGLRSNSPFYRFLCFFNVAARINDVTKSRLRKVCVENGVEVPKLNGNLSADGVIDVVAPELIGAKYTDLINRYRSEYRNAIAHFDTDDRLVPFDMDAESQARTAAIVMSVLSRDLLDQAAVSVRDLIARGVDVESLDFDAPKATSDTQAKSGE
jgi:hypothetical protein